LRAPPYADKTEVRLVSNLMHSVTVTKAPSPSTVTVVMGSHSRQVL
jgi:hypothetical protein